MKKAVGVSMLATGILLWFGVGLFGQSPRSRDIRSGDTSSTPPMPVEPDSPGTASAVGADPQAIVPRLMKFSGTLRDATGKPVTGAVDVTFSLYSTEAGGDSLWFETQSVQADELGRYTALLGAMHTDGLPVDLFTSGEVRWLGIQVGAEAEQQPRVLLVSVPYALKAGDAETLGGKPASAYVLADAQNGTATGTATTSTSGATPAGTKGTTAKSSKTNVSPLVAVCSTITSNVGGTATFLPMFTAQCNIENSVITQSGGNVGIGTVAPGAQLDVQNPTTQNNIALRATNANGTMMFIPNLSAGAYNGLVQTGDQGMIFYGTAPGAGNFVLGPWGSGGMRMTNTGKVGIGTATPAAMLDVNGTAQFDNAVTIATAQSLSGPELDVQTPAFANTISLRATNAKGTMMLIPNLGAGAYNGLVQAGDQGLIFYGTAPNAGNFVIGPWSGGGSPGIRMTAAGNVGIGTSAPSAMLDVNGTAKATAFSGDGTNLINVNAVKLGGMLPGAFQLSGSYATTGSNTFTATQTITGGNLALPSTAGSGVGVLTLGGVPFLHGYGSFNIFVGPFAGNFTTTGVDNTASGYAALLNDTTGGANTASGWTALSQNTTGYSNTASGTAALQRNTTGYSNTASGGFTLYHNDTGFLDTALGYCALLNTYGTTGTPSTCLVSPVTAAGSDNTAIGTFAGQTNTTGMGNTFLGYSADAGSATLTNATAIGANAVVGGSNALVLGSINGLNGATSNVNVGIGTSTPSEALEVVGNVKITTSGNGVIFSDGTKQTTAGGGGGTVTSVGSGAGLTGGPITTTGTLSIATGGVTNAMLANSSFTVGAGADLLGGGTAALGSGVTLNLDTSKVPQLATANTFAADQTLTAALNLANTTGADAGVINLGGTRFIHAFGTANTFVGPNAGNFTTTGSYNTAEGWNALESNTGDANTAVGASALTGNTTGADNTAVGRIALPANTSGSNNVAVGYTAGQHLLTGGSNILIGYAAGSNFTSSESNNIDIGSIGVTGESSVIRIGAGSETAAYIKGVYGTTVTGASTVLINSSGQLGTISSSRRYKEDIQDMASASDGLLRLRPVTFRYKKASEDGSKPIQYGLIAEEVAGVYPDLVAFNQDGQPETVQYYKLDAMLLNEVQKLAKEHAADQAEIAKLAHASATKGEQIEAMSREIEQFRRAQEQMALVMARLDSRVRGADAAAAARLARLESAAKKRRGPQNRRSALPSPVSRKPACNEIVRVGF